MGVMIWVCSFLLSGYKLLLVTLAGLQSNNAKIWCKSDAFTITLRSDDSLDMNQFNSAVSRLVALLDQSGKESLNT